MKMVRWTDNTGSVGYTCMTGYFTPDDMRWLLSMVPDPNDTHFSQGFHWPNKPYGKITPELFEEHISIHDWGPQKCFYFQFKDGDDAVPLIAALRIQGYRMTRGEGSYVKY